MNRLAIARAALFAAAAIVAAPPLLGRAAASAPVDFVYEYQGFSDAYRIVDRNDRGKPVAPLAPLANGDVVSVSAPKDRAGTPTSIVLSIGGERYTVTSSNSPFCVGRINGNCKAGWAQQALESATQNPIVKVFDSILASIVPIFGQAQDDSYSTQTAQMVARGAESPAPQIPMLPSSPLALEPASSSLIAFGWLGGQPPFTVAVLPASSEQPLAQQSGVTENSVTIQGRHCRPGTYRVQIEDAAHEKIGGAFQCVAQGLPALPIDEISGDLQMPPAAIATIRAGLLARHGRQWYLAAYQELAPFVDDAPNGQVHNLRYWLSEGLPPP